MHTLETLFTAYLAEMQLEHAASTQYQQRCFFTAVLRQCGPLPLDVCTAAHWQQWKAAVSLRLARPTVHKYLGFLTRAFRMAVQWGWLPANPLALVRKPPVGPGRMRILTEPERDRLLRACRQSPNWTLYPLVLLALATGGRKNELRRLCWSAVDLEAGLVRFTKTKTHLDRSVPVLGAALEELRRLCACRPVGIPLIFAREDGTRPREMECAWTTARRRAGLADLRFHDLRHTYASWLAMNGSTLADIATLLGHTKVAQSFRYIHLMPSHTRGVVQAMVDKYLPPPGDTP